MNDLEIRLTELETLTRENNKTLWKIHAKIFGNGEPGLVTQLALLTQSVQAHHQTEVKRGNDWKWVITTGIAIAAVVVAIYK